MATSGDYTGWAVELDGLADDLEAHHAPLAGAWSAGPVVGGALALTVGRAVEASLDNAASAAADLRTLAEECRQRAVVCARYTVALRRYEHAVDGYRRQLAGYVASWELAPPRPPVPPPSPAAWVEASPGEGGPR